MERMRYVLQGRGPFFTLVLLFGVVLNAVAAVADPLILKFLIDEGLMEKDYRTFWIFAVAMLVFGVGMRVGNWAYQLAAQKLQNSIHRSLSLRMLGSFFRIPYSEVARSDDGYHLSLIHDEPSKVAKGAVSTWIGFAIQGASFVAAAVVALALSWKITLILSLVVPLLYWLASRFGPKIQEASRSENEEEARLRENLAASTGAYTTVRIFGLHEPLRRRAGETLDRFLGVLYRRVRTAKTYGMASKICLSLAELAVLLAAGYGVVTGALTIGGLFGFLKAFWKVIGAANGVIGLIPKEARLRGYLDRLRAFDDKALPGDEAPDLPASRDLDLREVSFAHDDRALFEGFDLQVREGERLLLVGPNGCGKSTLAYLMLGLLEPDQGTVRGPHLERVSAQLDPFGFIPGTLKENADYESLEPEQQQRFDELARELGLEDKIDQWPGRGFSAGERKKAQILLTLLKDADLYLFDEPLANVDSDSKERIMKRQIERTEGKTLIVVMHGDERLHSYFDRVVRLPGAGRGRHEPTLVEEVMAS